MVEKCTKYQNKGSQGSLRARHLTKKFAWLAEICQILKVYPGVSTGIVLLGID